MATIVNTSQDNDVGYITVYDCIASAVRQCGMRDSDITPAIISYAKLRLNLILQNLTNRNIPLWLIETVVVGLSLNQVRYELPQYVYEILNCNWRRNNPTQYIATGGTDADYLSDRDWNAYAVTTDNFTLQLLQPEMGTYGLLFFGTQTLTLTISTSTDGTNYTVLKQYATQEYQDGIWLWNDINPSLTVNYVRVSCASGETMSLRNIYIANLESSNEIVMTRMNRDTYAAYPNKNMMMTPVAYYFDRQITPLLNIWGQPTNVYDWSLVLRWQRNFQNVGALTQQLQVPLYYLDAVISELASRLILELPKDQADLSRIPVLKQKAAEDLSLAETSSMDLDPISISPNISCYTN